MIDLNKLYTRRLTLCGALIVVLIFNPTSATKADDVDRIIGNLFTNYKKEVHPPTTRTDGAVEVGISVVPLFLDIDEPSSVFNCHFWLGMFWKDSRLQWDAKQYSNVSLVHLAPESVWKPDIRMFNSIKHEDYEDTDVLLGSSGTLFWVPPVTSHTSCNLDFSFWPWDVQTCSLTIGSWTNHGWEIDVVNLNGKNRTKVSTENFVPALWTILSASAKRNVRFYSGIDEPWPDVTVKFTIKRNSAADKKVAVLPVIVVSCLCLACFWTHPLNRARLQLTCLNVIILVITIYFLRSLLPRPGAQLPYVVSFSGSLMVLVTIQFLVSLTMTNLVSRTDSPPNFLISPLENGFLGRILCISDTPIVGTIRSIDVEAMERTIHRTEAGANCDSGESTYVTKGWTIVAQAVDRILFVVYFLIVFIFLGAYLGGAGIIIDKFTK